MSLFTEITRFCSSDFSDKPFCMRPWGGSGGDYWSFNEQGNIIIKQIEIAHGSLIDSITFSGELDGKKVYSKFGGSGGGSTTKIELNSQEYLTHISGTSGDYVDSLKFITNLKTVYGPFGGETGGDRFTLPVKGGTIVGFHGRSGSYIDAIGVYMNSAPKKPIHVGVWGGEGGDAWSVNEDGLAIMNQIKIRHGEVIYSISFKYEVDGKEHTNTFGSRSSSGVEAKIDLNWPQEYVIGISGYMKADHYLGGGNMHLKLLTFVTNKKSYGPYGTRTGSFFTSPTDDLREIVGFHGRAGDVIDAIGIYREPI